MSDGLIPRCRLWLRLMDLLKDDQETQTLAATLAAHLDSAYTALACDAYSDGINEGRAVSTQEDADTIRGLREEIAALEQHVAFLTGTTTDEAQAITH